MLPIATFALALPAGAGEEASLPRRLAGPVAAQVVDVVDGDTLTVKAHVWLDQEIVARVRLAGIDTPELRGECQAEKDLAQEAKRHLERLVTTADTRVLLSQVEHDKYGGRVLAKVGLPDGTDLAAALISAGHARAHAGGRRQGWCAVAARP